MLAAISRNVRRRLSTVAPHVRGRLRRWLDRSKAALDREAHRKLEAFLGSPRRLQFPRPAQPQVSVLVVTYNRAELTLECLEGLAVSQDRSFELILVDNASTDRTAELLGRLDHAVVLRNAVNAYYAPAVNQAAAVARGRYLLLLNNDAVPRADAIGALRAAADASAAIGAVGARLVLRDGRLQEAGSIVFSDGSAMGYGRGEDPDGADYVCAREVDYCSGACLLVRRDLFEEIGGFDLRYLPAYYEDVDLCFAIRERGRKVVYEPRAVVRHAEFGSSSPERAAELCRRNRPLFYARWKERLHAAPPPGATASQLRSREAGRALQQP
ncbi:MAG TPA: glycosyltransferase family 2 protein [Candidatus Limnocylindrales bacterium]|nr:glycosyltransferase family 2 protein [Candidatus Limnocylindrales bacterium]